MKLIYLIPATACIALIVQTPALGQQQPNQNKKQQETKHASGSTTVHHQSSVKNTAGQHGHSTHVAAGSTTVHHSSASVSTVHHSQTASQVHAGNGQSHSHQTYTKNNNYGGLWVNGNTHPDWNRNSQHQWNDHNYRWYDGGWLIIASSFSPGYSGGPSAGGAGSGSVVGGVQQSLASQGYYRGAVDGAMGPATRRAISGYQNDHSLSVTGTINDPLLQSLQLE